MTADFSQIATPPSADLGVTVAALVAKLRAAEAKAADLVEQAQAAVAEADRLALVEIPAAMGTLEQIRLGDGSVLTVKDALKASVSEANRPQAWAWLRENGHGAVIKESELIDLRGVPAQVKKKLEALLAKAAVTHEAIETVHPQTLMALCRELLEKGVKLPSSFSIFQYKKAVITTPKQPKRK